MPKSVSKIFSPFFEVEEDCLTYEEITEMMKPTSVQRDPSMDDFAQRVDEVLRKEEERVSFSQMSQMRKIA